MSREDQLESRLRAIEEALAHDSLRPDENRDDWDEHRSTIEDLRLALESLVKTASSLEAGRRRQVAAAVGPMAALLHAAGAREAALSLLSAALPLAPDDGTRALWVAADRYLHVFASLELAHWYQRRGDSAEAARIASTLVDHREASVAKAARALAGRAPGSRRTSSGRGFLREPALWKTIGVTAGLVAAFAGLQHLGGPDRKVSREIAALQAPAAPLTQGDRDDRLSKLEALIDREHRGGKVGRRVLAEGALAMVDLLAAPTDPARAPGVVEPALHDLARLRALPEIVRDDAFADRAAALVQGWIAAHRQAAPDAVDQALRLCLAGRRLVPGPKTPLAATEKDLRAELAQRLLRDGWAADAFRQLARLDDHAAATRALQALGPSHAAWLALAPEIETWARRAGAQASEGTAQRLAAARRHDKDRALVPPPAERGLAELERAHRDAPDDEDVAVALAQALRDGRDPAGALRVLQTLGPPGRLTRPAQRLLADLLEQAGNLPAAEALLERIFVLDFPEYEAVRELHEREVSQRREALVPEARTALESRLAAAGRDRADPLMDEWIAARLDEDSSLAALRAQMKASSVVVGTGLQLGMVRLARAQAAEGEERQTLLARAEQDLLAIAFAARGAPSFHLSLGEVYHRLGKAQKGDRELSVLLAQNDPELHLAVARTYRGVGLIEQATKIATSVHLTAGGTARTSAAFLLYLLTPRRDEKERWLRKADEASPQVRAALLDIEASRLYERGDLAGADAKYAAVLEIFMTDAETDSSSANNAALAAGERYLCTGDARHLDTAIRLLESSIALSPTSAIATGNLAFWHEYRARIRLLDRWVDIGALRPTYRQADALVRALARGPLRPAVAAALRASDDARRSQALRRRQQVLAPSSPTPYEGLLDWYHLLDDAAAMTALEAQVRAQVKLDVSWDAAGGGNDGSEEDRKSARAGRRKVLDELAARLTPVGANPRARRTLAAVWAMRSAHHGEVRGEEREVLAARDQASALWPDLARGSLVSDEVFALALDEAGEGHPPLRERWEKAREEPGTSDPEIFVHDLLNENDDASLAALRRSPTLAAFVTRRRADLAPVAAGDEGLGTFADWCAGKLLGDETLAAAGLAYMQRPSLQTSARLYAALAPYSKNAQRWAEVVGALGGGPGTGPRE